MNKQRITEIIATPGNLNYNSDYPLVKELIESFPYFSTPYVMLSKMLHDENSIYFDKNLKISAAYIGNREILYDYIHKKPEEAIELQGIVEKEPLEVSEIVQETTIVTKPIQSIDIVEEVQPQEMESVPAAVQIHEEKESKPISNHINHFHDFGNEILQYPITDYFSQLYKKEPRTISEKKEILAEESPDPLSGKKSFSDWLNTIERRNKVISKEKTTPKAELAPADHSNVNELINKFIHAEPKIKPQQSRMYKPEDMAKLSVQEDHNIATETLANIYLKQGLKSRALEIFQQLILKYPEKSDYFAGKIKEIQTEGSF